MRLLLGTRNAAKAREIARILTAAADIELLSLDDVELPYTPDEERIEAFETFRESAAAKARYYAERTGIPTIADDSGLAVDALGGRPGVHSKRFSGRTDLEGEALDRENNRLLLQELEGVPPARRTAHFTCAVALATRKRTILTTIGTCAGAIATEPRGTHGFGYDPLFLLPDIGVTFAEVAPDEKNRRSHRARALHALAAQLSELVHQGLTKQTTPAIL